MDKETQTDYTLDTAKNGEIIMNFEYIRSIPKSSEIIAAWPLPAELVELKRKRDREIQEIITGVSNRFLLVVGPCSADNEDAVCDYVSRLRTI